MTAAQDRDAWAATSRRHGLADWCVPAVLCLLLCITMLYLSWPGFRTSDSSEMWLQARTGEFTNVHAPVMSIMWSVLDKAWPHSGNLHTVHVVFAYAAFLLLSLALFRRWPARVVFLVALGTWPSLTASIAHIWKDTPMLAFFVMATALFLIERRQPARWALHLAAVMLAAACLYRHNALPAVLPLLYWYVHRLGVAGQVRKLALTAGLAGVVLVLSNLPNLHRGVSERQVWPVVAVWDLAAVSIETGVMRIPPRWHAADLTLAELEEAFQPWSNTTIFDGGKLLISLYVEPDDERSMELLRAWLGLWVHEPMAIARHRLRLTANLLGLQRQGVPFAMHWSPRVVNLPGNPPLALPANRLRDAWSAFIGSRYGSVFFLGYAYVGAVILGLTCALRRRDLLAAAIASSALLCVGTLVLFAPSAEFRYLLWPNVVALIFVGRFSHDCWAGLSSRHRMWRARHPGDAVTRAGKPARLPGSH